MSAVSCPRLGAALALAIAVVGASLAAPAAGAEPVAPPLWEIGAFAFGASQQAYPGSDTQLRRALALPYFIYRGQWLRADRETLGLRAVKTERLELDLGAAGSFGGGSDEIEARRGMRELGTRVELGPRLKVRLGDGARSGGLPGQPGDGQGSGPGVIRAELPLRGVFDLNDRGSYRGLAFEPRLLFERQTAGGWRYSTALGALFADRRLADDFYGVSAQHAAPGRPAYTARGGLVSTRLSLSVSRSVGPDWRIFGVARYDTVQGAANESSPLVRKKGGGSLGFGVAFTFARSAAGAFD